MIHIKQKCAICKIMFKAHSKWSKEDLEWNLWSFSIIFRFLLHRKFPKKALSVLSRAVVTAVKKPLCTKTQFWNLRRNKKHKKSLREKHFTQDWMCSSSKVSLWWNNVSGPCHISFVYNASVLKPSKRYKAKPFLFEEGYSCNNQMSVKSTGREYVVNMLLLYCIFWMNINSVVAKKSFSCPEKLGSLWTSQMTQSMLERSMRRHSINDGR